MQHKTNFVDNISLSLTLRPSLDSTRSTSCQQKLSQVRHTSGRRLLVRHHYAGGGGARWALLHALAVAGGNHSEAEKAAASHSSFGVERSSATRSNQHNATMLVGKSRAEAGLWDVSEHKDHHYHTVLVRTIYDRFSLVLSCVLIISIGEKFKLLNHGRKVNFVDTMFQMLEKYSNNLEELIRERTEQLEMERKKTEQLLNRMLPRWEKALYEILSLQIMFKCLISSARTHSSVAEKLKMGLAVDPEEFADVTIYFSGEFMRNLLDDYLLSINWISRCSLFCQISSVSPPSPHIARPCKLLICLMIYTQTLMPPSWAIRMFTKWVESSRSQFITLSNFIILCVVVFQVETIGDAYMVVGGLPNPRPDHAEQIATMALDLLHQSGNFKVRHLPGVPLQLRIGLHTGWHDVTFFLALRAYTSIEFLLLSDDCQQEKMLENIHTHFSDDKISFFFHFSASTGPCCAGVVGWVEASLSSLSLAHEKMIMAMPLIRAREHTGDKVSK